MNGCLSEKQNKTNKQTLEMSVGVSFTKTCILNQSKYFDTNED